MLGLWMGAWHAHSDGSDRSQANAVAASATGADGAALLAELPGLRALCQPFWGELAPACMAALDRVYMDRDVRRNWRSAPEREPHKMDAARPWRPRLARDRIAWRDLFADPLTLHVAVDEAAAKPRCRAKVGEAPHHLRAACAADAFARLAALHYACGTIRYWEGSEHHRGWAMKWAWERDRPGSAADRARRRAGIDESELHFAWRRHRCLEVPEAAMSRVVQLRWPNVYYSEHSQWAELMVAAARLGSPWANMLAEAPIGGAWAKTRFGPPGVELNATAESSQVLAYVRRARGSGDSRYWHLPYLLAARERDSHAHAPQIDWSDLERHFAAADIDRAWPAAEQLLGQGWRPMEGQPEADDTAPWAVAPAVRETRTIRQRLDRYGHIRWVYESGREVWIGSDGNSRYALPNGEEGWMAHEPMGERSLPKLRSWVDENGRSRWLDHDGVEHWFDADGAEHWVDFGGVEWILLPP